MRKLRRWVLPDTYLAFVLAGLSILPLLYLISRTNYLLFHSLAEMFSIVIACAVFVVFWNSRQFLDNGYFLFIGIAFLFIGGLDLLHLLAYKGMGVFPGYDADLPTQLWIAFRYVTSLSFVGALLLLRHKPRPGLVVAGYAAVTGLLLLSIFYWRVFPACYVEGAGLTPFKKISEYVISLIFLLSAVLLYRRRYEFDTSVFTWLMAAVMVSIASELAFTLYIDVYGLPNLVGHFLEIVSVYLVYKAFIVVGLKHPFNLMFRNLTRSQEALQASEARYRMISELGSDGAYAYRFGPEGELNREWVTEAMTRITGFTLDELDARGGWLSMLHPDDRSLIQQRVETLRSGQSDVSEYRIITKAGETRWLRDYSRPVWDGVQPAAPTPDGTSGRAGTRVVGFYGAAQDITERWQARQSRELLIAQLQEALREIKTLSGLIPICASCKKIRDDQGYWQQLEAYIQEHSDAQFSHGICPDCARRLYPELYGDEGPPSPSQGEGT
jgi:PAS domain S-box-containing protein